MRKARLPRFSAALWLLVAGIIAAGTAFAIYSFVAPDGSPTPLTLGGGVSLEKARASGLALNAPDGDNPAVTADEAREIARGTGGPGEVLDVVLAHVVDSRQKPSLDRLVWVIHYDPATIPLSGEEGQDVVLWLGLVDAKTGEFLDGYGETQDCDTVAECADTGTPAHKRIP